MSELNREDVVVRSARNGAVVDELPIVGGGPTMKDQVYAALRERIVFGTLLPGDRLVEADLAARFRVSKTPVREALLTLEAEGLVTLRPHRGAEVTRLSPQEYRDLQFVRDALEFGAMPEIVASIAEVDLRRAEAHLAEMEAAYAAQDYRRYRWAQRLMHHGLLSVPGHPTLPELAMTLHDRLDRYGRLLVTARRERWASDLQFNRRRLELIRARDVDGVVRMVREQHARAVEDLEQEILPSLDATRKRGA